MPRVKQCRKVGCHQLATNGRAYCDDHRDLEEADKNRHDKYMAQRYNKQTRNRNETKQEQTSFYRTKQWVELRKVVLNRDSYLCQYCAAQGRVTPAKVVDHIVPIEYDVDRKADVENLAIICGRCHSKKTTWEQSYYGTGTQQTKHSVPKIKSVAAIAKLIEK
ncbi:HNH endonuclease [Weissella viridescens]|uniref:HNH endonuclease n=1 Tax=Weissella viridescens TaxID=1629 RepID=UPI0022E19234|nr:HNH endonuclease [Weissella viridescens]